jgi:hypothetical protein
LESFLKDLAVKVDRIGQQQQAAHFSYTTATTATTAAGCGVAAPNLSDPSNLAGELHLRYNNPVPRPMYLAADDAIPCLFDLSSHTGARRVRATLGTAASYEIETLGCGLSFLFDSVQALTEITSAVKLLSPWGPNGSIAPEHLNLETRLSRVTTYQQKIVELFFQRFSLLVAAAASPANKALLPALTARVRGSVDYQLDPSVQAALQDLESKRADAQFKSAANHEANRGSGSGHQRFHQDRTSGPASRGRGYSRGRGRRGGGRWSHDREEDYSGASTPSTSSQ